MTNPCPICNDWCGPKSKEISHKRATKTAHALAIQKATEGIKGLEWEEVYSLFFPKIYRHEYQRNLKLEQEIELEESVARNMNNPDVCSYHDEDIGWTHDGTHKESMKGLRREYAESKWPKPLKD
jgi:hypothetical protein